MRHSQASPDSARTGRSAGIRLATPSQAPTASRLPFRGRLAYGIISAGAPSPRHLRALEHLLLHRLTQRGAVGARSLLEEARILELLAEIGLIAGSSVALRAVPPDASSVAPAGAWPATSRGAPLSPTEAVRCYERLADEVLGTNSFEELETRALLHQIRSLKYQLRQVYLDPAVIVAAVATLLIVERLVAQPGYVRGSGSRFEAWPGRRLPVEEAGAVGEGARNPGSRGGSPVRPAVGRALKLEASRPSVRGPGVFPPVGAEAGETSESSGHNVTDVSGYYVEHVVCLPLPGGISDHRNEAREGHEQRLMSEKAVEKPSAGKRMPETGGTVRSVLPRAGREVQAVQRASQGGLKDSSSRARKGGRPQRSWAMGIAIINMLFVSVVGTRLISSPPVPPVDDSARYQVFTFPAGIEMPVRDARRFGDVLMVTVDRQWSGLTPTAQQDLVRHLARHLVGQEPIARMVVLDAAGRQLATATGEEVQLSESLRQALSTSNRSSGPGTSSAIRPVPENREHGGGNEIGDAAK